MAEAEVYVDVAMMYSVLIVLVIAVLAVIVPRLAGL